MGRMSPDEPVVDCVCLDDILEEQIRKCVPVNTKCPSITSRQFWMSCPGSLFLSPLSPPAASLLLSRPQRRSPQWLECCKWDARVEPCDPTRGRHKRIMGADAYVEYFIAARLLVQTAVRSERHACLLISTFSPKLSQG